jgi:hypothetical protein
VEVRRGIPSFLFRWDIVLMDTVVGWGRVPHLYIIIMDSLLIINQIDMNITS